MVLSLITVSVKENNRVVVWGCRSRLGGEGGWQVVICVQMATSSAHGDILQGLSIPALCNGDGKPGLQPPPPLGKQFLHC